MLSDTINRRAFLKEATTASLALGLSGGAAGLLGSEEEKPVRVGFVGVGRRGTSILRETLGLEGVEVTAMCDIDEEHLGRAQRLVERSGKKKPEGYSRGPEDFRRMVERDDLDAVITATPWKLHTPVMLAAMEAGKYGATEVPAAVTLDECWQLVETSERTGMPCMMLENYCYFSEVMAVLNMVQQGVFGELVHCEAGYQHDIRFYKFDPDGELTYYGKHSADRDGNLYPTHAIGPVAWWTGINRGDRFTHLVSMSSKSLGLNRYISKKFGPEHPNAKRKYASGDVNTTLIKTEKGLTVTLYYNTNLPRPFNLIYRVQGTEGLYSGTLKKLYIEDRSPEEHTWEEFEPYHKEYEHPLMKKYGQDVTGSFGTFLEVEQFIYSVRHQVQPPIDVYDSATWSAISQLTEQSLAGRSKAVDFPDFTRGKWKEERPVMFYGI
ncbi:MAG: Gfo/Idh/MocA family oxidoreductase [Gemmatimonadota bacterium]|nr:Gfo/Idh/MocA family oxidoreductase [Gemmatimonadota bacterium]